MSFHGELTKTLFYSFKTKSVLKTSSKSQHRSSEVSGWLCIPKSVVMATSLELKLAKRLENGQALNISSKWNSKKKQLHEKTVVYAEAQKYRPGRFTIDFVM